MLRVSEPPAVSFAKLVQLRDPKAEEMDKDLSLRIENDLGSRRLWEKEVERERTDILLEKACTAKATRAKRPAAQGNSNASKTLVS